MVHQSVPRLFKSCLLQDHCRLRLKCKLNQIGNNNNDHKHDHEKAVDPKWKLWPPSRYENIPFVCVFSEDSISSCFGETPQCKKYKECVPQAADSVASSFSLMNQIARRALSISSVWEMADNSASVAAKRVGSVGFTSSSRIYVSCVMRLSGYSHSGHSACN